MADSKRIVLDTCALLWWTLAPEKLSAPASALIEGHEQTDESILVSSISVWEIGVKVKYKNLDLGVSLHKYVDLLKDVSAIKLIPVDEQLWLDNLSLDWGHNDPADRTIVALASNESLPLVTSDDKIRQFYNDCVW